MGITTDPNDPRLTRGVDTEPVPQADVYLALSAKERKKGYVRPLRFGYIHKGPSGPRHPLRDLNDEETARYVTERLVYMGIAYVKFEEYPPGGTSVGRYWTQEQLDAADGGCGAVTTMAQELAETYARDPSFYGATYCTYCRKHLPVDEFVWDDRNDRVGS